MLIYDVISIDMYDVSVKKLYRNSLFVCFSIYQYKSKITVSFQIIEIIG